MFCSALYGAVRLCCRRATPHKYPGNHRAAEQPAANRPAANRRARDSRAYHSARDTRARELVQRSAR